MTADSPLMTPDQMLRALDYVSAAWRFDEETMDRLDRHAIGELPIRHLLADTLRLMVISSSVATAADEGPAWDHATALGTTLISAVQQWADTAEPDADAGELPDYRHADMGIAKTIASYLLETFSGEPGDLESRLQAFRSAWSGTSSAEESAGQ